MKKDLFRLTIYLTILALIFWGLYTSLRRPTSVRAFGDLTVDFHVPAGNPIFVVNNMAPGQVESRNVDVHNGGVVSRMVAVKGVKVSGDDPFAAILQIVITEGATDRYGGTAGTKTLANFFADSSTTNGILLSNLASGGNTTYTFKVTFPASAGNEFQGKSIVFDLTFGQVGGDNVVINEIYYQVDTNHGLDSPKDRGVTVGGNHASNTNTGAGSTNIANASSSNSCNVNQTNSSTVNNNVSVNANTGGNQANGNTGSGNIITGAISAVVNIFNGGSSNTTNSCGNKLGQNDEWIELYNPTNHDISLKNWTLTDNSGQVTIIHPNKIIKAGGFALLSKSASTWQFWNENPAAVKIELGSNIGDGLDNGGDRVILKNSTGQTVDALSYGADTTVFNPSIPPVPLGSSFERIVAGFDTDVASDFVTRTPPTPGN